MKGFPMRERKIKILIAKPGLDGHDRGAKIVALALRDAGMEVVYTGLHQHVDQIVRTAIQEGVDIIGLSIMSGAHLTICENLLDLMKQEGIETTGVVVGGVIPAQDIAKLEKMGVQGIYPGGTPFDVMIEGIQEINSRR
jgi:methylmalonyl-CoA mutase, C-terminal domain